MEKHKNVKECKMGIFTKNVKLLKQMGQQRPTLQLLNQAFKPSTTIQERYFYGYFNDTTCIYIN